jgi:hypothetical protein
MNKTGNLARGSMRQAQALRYPVLDQKHKAR